MTATSIWVMIIISLVATFFWRRVIKTSRSAPDIIDGTLPSPKIPKIPAFVSFILQFAIILAIMSSCTNYATQNLKTRILIDRAGMGQLMRNGEVSDTQKAALQIYESSAELKSRQCLGRTKSAQEARFKQLMSKVEKEPLTSTEEACIKKVLKPMPSSMQKNSNSSNSGSTSSIAALLNLFEDEPEHAWEEINKFGYTPNKPDELKTFVFVAPQTGVYRVKCQEGFYHDARYVPCRGLDLPYLEPKNKNWHESQQVIRGNGRNLTNSVITLEKGKRLLVSVMTNLRGSSKRNVSVAEVFAANTGTTQFTVDRMIY